jgi:glycosyltransferase involved in cell wall biosynthesis
MKKFFFLWNEAPNYCISQIKYIKINNPNFDIKLISNYTKKKNNFVIPLKNNIKSWKNIALDIPDVLFVSGWSYKEFYPLINEVRLNNGKVVCLVDNSQKFSLKQFIGKIYFHFILSKKFDYFWVPGKSSFNLLRYFKIKKKLIFRNLYAVNNFIFYEKKKLSERSNDFIFVGQFINRKNIKLLIDAFNNFSKKIKENVKLYVITNSDNFKFPKNNNIVIKKNLTSLEISNYLNKIKFFVLLSKQDHWPLAALEAASCGNFLIVSKYIGSIGDVALKKNSLKIENLSIESISKIIFKLYKSHLDYTIIKNTNKKILNKYSLKSFNNTFNKIIKVIN